MTPTCVWRIGAELVAALDAAFGDPHDAYVNGSQTWLEENGPSRRSSAKASNSGPSSSDDGPSRRSSAKASNSGPSSSDDGPDRITLEWRLHPVAGYRRPAGIDTYAVFRAAADGLLEPATLWDGLEAFPAYDDATTVANLRAAATAALGVEPTAWGVVDHGPIGDEWEQTGGGISIIKKLLGQLARDAGGDAE